MSTQPELRILTNINTVPAVVPKLPYRVSIDNVAFVPDSYVDDNKPLIRVLPNSIVDIDDDLNMYGVFSAAEVKILYESNLDTNAFTDLDEAFINDMFLAGFPYDFDVDGGFF